LFAVSESKRTQTTDGVNSPTSVLNESSFVEFRAAIRNRRDYLVSAPRNWVGPKVQNSNESRANRIPSVINVNAGTQQYLRPPPFAVFFRALCLYIYMLDIIVCRQTDRSYTDTTVCVGVVYTVTMYDYSTCNRTTTVFAFVVRRSLFGELYLSGEYIYIFFSSPSANIKKKKENGRKMRRYSSVTSMA